MQSRLVNLVLNKLRKVQYDGIATPSNDELYLVIDDAGITSADVINALGYTPYNSTNPDHYITSSSLPTVNDGTLTITQGGSTLGTFTANQSSNTTIDIPGGGYNYDTANVCAIGTPTINSTVMSGFTATDYAIRTEKFNFGTNPWELWTEFTTNTIGSKQYIFYGGKNKLSIYLDSTDPGALIVVVGTATNIFEVLSANTTYKVRIVSLADKDLNATSNTNVYIYDENDSLLFSHSINNTVSQIGDLYFGVGISLNSIVSPFNGSINFENTYINQIDAVAQTTTRVWSGGVPVLDSKANTDFSNVSRSRGILEESYTNGTSWYRVYSDGWCEQGGYKQRTGNTTSIDLLQNYTTTDFSIQVTMEAAAANKYAAVITNKTVSSISVYCGHSEAYYYWRCAGYIS